MVQNLPKKFFTFALLGSLFFSSSVFASSKCDCDSPQKDRKYEFQYIPVPVIESRPDEGQTYGLMNVLLASKKGENAISAIFGAIGQYNTVYKTSGALLAYFYPSADEEILFYAELAQDYYREVSGRFFDPHFKENFYIEADVIYLKTPFSRFFGIGPHRREADQANHVSENFKTDATFGYYLLENFRANLTTRIHSTELFGRAIDDFLDTQTAYGALPQVKDSTNWINEISLSYDTRPQLEYSDRGVFLELAGLASATALGSDDSFQGYRFEAIGLIPTLERRMTTALRFNFQQLFGDAIPFYEMSQLGGSREFRAFTPTRYVDKGKIIFQAEERIRLFDYTVMGKTFSINFDPFVEVGRVFDSFNDFSFKSWQPTAGAGFRLIVPPNVVGRIDFGFGVDGVNIYTELGYPF